MIELIEDEEATQPGARIKVIGVGGAGGNAVNTMIKSGMSSEIEFIVMNTDRQDLARSLAPRRFQLGSQVTRGLGAGSDPEVGREAAMEDRQRIAELVMGADMVFVTAGMGGGTGSGAAPVVAQVARDCGALTVAVVTRPFPFELRMRHKIAERAIESLSDNVDSLLIIPNERLLRMADDRTTMMDAFRRADDVLLQAVKGVSDLIMHQGRMNVDFADIRKVMSGKGLAIMGVGTGAGEQRALAAAEKAVSSPLLDDVSIHGATSLLVNITSNETLTMHEYNEAVIAIQQEVHEDALVIPGWCVDESVGDEVQVTVIATGFKDRQVAAPSAERMAATAAYGGGYGRGGFRRNGRELHSGIDRMHDDYDIPTFFNND